MPTDWIPTSPIRTRSLPIQKARCPIHMARCPIRTGNSASLTTASSPKEVNPTRNSTARRHGRCRTRGNADQEQHHDEQDGRSVTSGWLGRRRHGPVRSWRADPQWSVTRPGRAGGSGGGTHIQPPDPASGPSGVAGVSARSGAAASSDVTSSTLLTTGSPLSYSSSITLSSSGTVTHIQLPIFTTPGAPVDCLSCA